MVHAPLAIHTNHSLTPLLICPHAHTCACVHIRNYSHSQLQLYTFTHTPQHFTLSPSSHSTLRTSRTIIILSIYNLILNTTVLLRLPLWLRCFYSPKYSLVQYLHLPLCPSDSANSSSRSALASRSRSTMGLPFDFHLDRDFSLWGLIKFYDLISMSSSYSSY